MEYGVCIRVLGDLTLLPVETRRAVAEVVKFTKNNTKYVYFVNTLSLLPDHCIHHLLLLVGSY